MVGQTIRLFVRALIIGVLVNMSLQHVSATPVPTSDEDVMLEQKQSPLSRSRSESEVHFSNQAGN